MQQAQDLHEEGPLYENRQADSIYPCPQHKLSSPILQAQVLLVLAAMLSHTEVCLGTFQQQQEEQGPPTSQQQQQQKDAQRLARTLLHLLQPAPPPPAVAVQAAEGQQQPGGPGTGTAAGAGAGEKSVGPSGAAAGGVSAGRSSAGGGDKAASGQAGRNSIAGGGSRKGTVNGGSNSSNAVKEEPGCNTGSAAGAATPAPPVAVIVQAAALVCLEQLVQHSVWVQLLLQQQQNMAVAVPAGKGRGLSASSDAGGSKSSDGQAQQQQQQQAVSMIQQLLAQLQLLAAAAVDGGEAAAAAIADASAAPSNSSNAAVVAAPGLSARAPQAAPPSQPGQASGGLGGSGEVLSWVGPAAGVVTGLLVHAGVEQMEVLGVVPALKVRGGGLYWSFLSFGEFSVNLRKAVFAKS